MSGPDAVFTEADLNCRLDAGFVRHDLDAQHALYAGRLPEALAFDAHRFEALWSLHPTGFHTVTLYGKSHPTPRWQQAFGHDYRYSGGVNRALPLPPLLEPLVAWARDAIDPRLNGLLVNWYDGQLGHYMGPHHDTHKFLVNGSPIVTISLGEERTFRLQHPTTKDRRDFPAPDGTVFVMPFATNLAWKHAVPHSTRHVGRRVSVTIRAFSE